MATPKKIIFDELKSKGLSRIVSKIKYIRYVHSIDSLARKGV